MAELSNLFGKDRDIVQETRGSLSNTEVAGRKLRVASNGTELEGFDLFAESTAGPTTFVTTGSSVTTTLQSPVAFDFSIFNNEGTSNGGITGAASFAGITVSAGGRVRITVTASGTSYDLIAVAAPTGVSLNLQGISGVTYSGTLASLGEFTVQGLAEQAGPGSTTVTGDLTVTGDINGTATEAGSVSEFGNAETETVISDQGTTLNFWVGTQAEYDDIATYSNQVVYLIQG